MATPPPEAPPVVKEDKPQLPPSPTGVAAPDLAPMRSVFSSSLQNYFLQAFADFDY